MTRKKKHEVKWKMMKKKGGWWDEKEKERGVEKWKNEIWKEDGGEEKKRKTET